MKLVTESYQEFVNESLNESDEVFGRLLTSKRFKMPTIRHLYDTYHSGQHYKVKNVLKKAKDKKRKIEQNYNDEQSRHNRIGKLQDMQHDLVKLREYIKQIENKFNL